MMEWLADFLGYHGPIIEEKQSDRDAWGYWMAEVEPRIHDRGLWIDYIDNLEWELGGMTSEVMQATLPQRAEALRRVLE